MLRSSTRRIWGSGGSGRNTAMNYPDARGRGVLSTGRSRSTTSMTDDLNINVMFSERGHLTLAHSDSALRTMHWRAEVNKLQDIDSSVIDPQQVKEIVPSLNISPDAHHPIVGALYHPPGGTIRHDAVVWGYARGADHRGVEMHQKTEVLDILCEGGSGPDGKGPGGKVTGVRTNKGDISAPIVVNCTATWLAHVGESTKRPDPNTATPAEWRDYLYLRDNVADWNIETWYCTRGCRKFFKLERRDNWVAITQRSHPLATERLIKARAKVLVVAPGLIERPYVFAGNDKPGVMMSGAVRRLVNMYAVKPGERAVVFSANADGAEDLRRVGIDVARVVDARTGANIVEAHGGAKRVSSVELADGSKIDADLLVVAAGWTAPTSLLNMAGDRPVYDPSCARFFRRPRSTTCSPAVASAATAAPTNSSNTHERPAAWLPNAPRSSPIACRHSRLAPSRSQATSPRGQSTLAPHSHAIRTPHSFQSTTTGMVDEDVSNKDLVAAAKEGLRLGRTAQAVHHRNHGSIPGQARNRQHVHDIASRDDRWHRRVHHVAHRLHRRDELRDPRAIKSRPPRLGNPDGNRRRSGDQAVRVGSPADHATREGPLHCWPGHRRAHPCGLEALIKLDKDDFVGKAELGWAMESRMDELPRVVAIQTVDPQIVPMEATQIVRAGTTEILGRITSSRMSPTLGRSVCMGQVHPSMAEGGTELELVLIPDSRRVKATVLHHHAHFDPEGERLRA
ncbi:Sarcosine oxidase subunit beta [Nymphon striatum]|nr:Sarcosine oxidase subunit beta [Nymphon striatum]